MARGQDSFALSISRDTASSRPRATKTSKYSREFNLPCPVQDDNMSTRERLLYTRGHAEHVVLANCRSPDGILSSEMASYTGSPQNTPDDIAIVDTSPDVADGEWAGTGDNGYGSFVCWETSLPDSYYDEALGTECSGVYDCNHEATPSVTPTSLATSTNSAASSHPPSRTGLSQGALIGLIIGCVTFFLLLLFASTLIFIRRLAVHKGHTGGLFSPFVPKPKLSPPPPPAVGYWGPDVSTLNDSDRFGTIEYLGPQSEQVYEVTGNCRYETTGDERLRPGRSTVSCYQ
ncbi:hypothetical protein VMCG_04886 [Cytospora schulzeri]|uniref:Uncharacterized protein n=1 Tax=Cytospora schulzeri TaxID=448051 RepID=A0A423WN73_9PEZI|nr:hypothetical protein VMCG_04886 [Valsa malicola]